MNARWALPVATVLVVAVTAVSLAVGVPRPPTLDPLPADRAPGAVAWTGFDEQPCVHLLDADGHDQRCGTGLDGVIVALDDGEVALAVHRDGDRPDLVTVDLADGAVVTRAAGDVDDPQLRRRLDDPWRHDDQAELTTSHVDGRLTVDVDGRTVWQVDADAGYQVASAYRDGDTVLLVDAADRLLVTDGTSPPRVWAEHVPAWGPLRWDPHA